MFKTARFVFGTASAMILFAGMAFAQQNPGIQTASRGTGASIIPTSDTTGFLTFFNDGLSRFQEVETVSAGANVGLGPRAGAGALSGWMVSFWSATSNVPTGNCTAPFLPRAAMGWLMTPNFPAT